MKKNLLARLEKLSDTSRDTGITFEQLGVDMLFVDESHEFKNLLVVSRLSNVAGVPNTDSQKANDMYLKTSYLNENNRGNVCFATGTPISNTMAELYNIQRYLQEDEMRERFNIHSFDGWAKTFGQVTSSFEISVDGKSFRNRMRFCKFFNVPELMNMFRDVAIIMTKSQLAKAMEDSELQRANSKAPGYIGGKPVIISNEASPELENFMSEIVERTEAIHAGGVDAKEDNMLLVTTESKKASLDLRLLGLQDEGTKLANVINSAFAVYKEYDDDNAAQLIFCDSSVPDPNNWNVYDHLKRGLMDKGVPENEIFFIHDAKTDIQRHELFQKVRKGYIRFLIGSTKKMGAGMNVQDRLIAIHHVDVPWRASDIEQRNGRGFRQGNQYDEIYEFRYVTKQSFDAYSWQMIETKASYSNQLMEGNSGMREIEEDSRAMFSYAEVKAIASGNPLIKEKMELEQEVKRLQNLKSGFNKEKWAMEKAIVDFPAKLHEEQNRLARFNADIELRDTNFGNWTLKSTSFNSEQIGEAGDYLLKLVERLRQDDRYRQGNRFKLGTFNGFELQIKKHFGDEILILKGQNEYQIDDSLSKMPRTNIERLSRKLNTITDFRNRTNERIESLIKDNTLYKEKVNDVFIYEDLLKKSELRLREVDELLSPDKESNNVVFDENESKDSEFDETEDEMEI